MAESKRRDRVRNKITNRVLRTTLAASLATVASLVFLSAPASAIYNHQKLEATISTGGCGGGFESSIYDIAIDEAHGWIYATCPQPYPAGWQVKRFNLN